MLFPRRRTFRGSGSVVFDYSVALGNTCRFRTRLCELRGRLSSGVRLVLASVSTLATFEWEARCCCHMLQHWLQAAVGARHRPCCLVLRMGKELTSVADTGSYEDTFKLQIDLKCLSSRVSRGKTARCMFRPQIVWLIYRSRQASSMRRESTSKAQKRLSSRLSCSLALETLSLRVDALHFHER